MRFDRITLKNVRVIDAASLLPGPGFNYITGDNGSGKTSLLEGIHVLSTGSSFRTRRPANLIRQNEDKLQSIAQFHYRKDGKTHSVGVERSRNGDTQARLNREPTQRLSSLTQAVPLLSLHPESHQLVNGGPSLRRKLIDWGVFHVEPRFITAWRDYKRALEQRNAALKQGADNDTVRAWNNSLADSGERLQGFRAAYLKGLLPYINKLLMRAGLGENLSLSLRCGWDEARPFAEALENSMSKDRIYRTTISGPHRAELAIRDSGTDVRNTFSRGQQKHLVYLIKIAQAHHLYRARQVRSVFLCDDLPAELDPHKRQHICQELLNAGFQVFCTSVDSLNEEFQALKSSVFHVEHGEVSQVV